MVIYCTPGVGGLLPVAAARPLGADVCGHCASPLYDNG